MNVSVLVPSKKSRPYNNHGYSRGCFALLCFAQGAFQLGNRRFFSVHAASFTFGGGGGCGRVPLSYLSQAC